MMRSRLDKLKAQRATLDERIRQERNRESERARKADTRKKILVGAYALEQAARDPAAMAALMRGLDAFLARDEDRVLFSLPLRLTAPNGAAVAAEPPAEGDMTQAG
jgi:hypothetical protein